MNGDDSCVCICGKSFSSRPGALTYHQTKCQKSKKRLSAALETARVVLKSRKRQRLEKTNMEDLSMNPHLEAPSTATNGENLPQHPTVPELLPSQPSPAAAADSSLSLAERRPQRLNRQLPLRFRDNIPQPLRPLPPESIISSPTPPTTRPDSPGSSSINPTSPSHGLYPRTRRIFTTFQNDFGLWRRYHTDSLPSHDPEEHIGWQHLVDDPLPSTDQEGLDDTSTKSPIDGKSFGPFPNENALLLGEWYWNHGIQKSQDNFKKLLAIIGSKKFRPEDVRNTNWKLVDKALARNPFDEDGSDPEWIDEDAGWVKTPIHISVPFHNRTRNPGPKDYVVGDLYHRPLVSIIVEKIRKRYNPYFHHHGFELFWKPTEQSPDIRVHGELYTSPAYLEAQREVQESPGEPGCNLPRVVVAMMFWSDSTHLTSFGNAKLWPCYLFFGNESKYQRCKPSCHLCEHVAYFQTLPDSFKDFATKHTGDKVPSKQFMTHCRRELLHAQWEILLDDDFLEAYKHGIVIECCDGTKFRFYPRILTYSADYPEKVILASIRDKGFCPCPRCLMPLARVQSMGMVRDMKERCTLARVDDEARRWSVQMARDIIYNKGFAVDTNAVEALLRPQSLVPTVNAFSKRLSSFGFNLYQMFVVDILHEFELGIWKALFIHLLRMLYAVDKTLVNELDRRFRQMPTFGRDTIRRFSSNISELKKLAARDFENILQCAIPAFDGLLPEPHNKAVLNLLFTCAHWHGLAKLRMHTDVTLDIFDEATVQLGAAFRAFVGKTCPAFDTRELRREAESRQRRRRKKMAEGQSSGLAVVAESDGKESLRKTLNLRRYKYHSLGDYSKTVRQFGTTDSFSTEPGELEHRTPKARYKRTDKKAFVRQLARIERREARLRRLQAKLRKDSNVHAEAVAHAPQEHHHIGSSQNVYEHIGTFLRNHSGDPAIQKFLPKLKTHLLSRILTNLGAESETHDHAGSESRAERIYFKHDRMYKHNIARINYTTYDVRRGQEVFNPSTSHHNVMVLTGIGGQDPNIVHPFVYARVLGIYHVNAVYAGFGMTDYRPRRMDFLWVRWYQRIETIHAGWGARRLDRLEFPAVGEENAFGFIDPADVLRCCHIIPAFSSGRVHADGRGLSFCAGDSSDSKSYYVNRFVDRDMMMRYHFNLGVGHTYLRFKLHDSDSSSNAGEPVEENGGDMDAHFESASDPGSEDVEDSEDDDDSESESGDQSDDEEFLALSEMYDL